MSGGWAGSTRGVRTSSSTWRRLRDQVLERDSRTCYVCGGPGADAVDHKVPVSRGGTDDLGNLAAIHDRTAPHCHRKKTSAEGNSARPRQNRTPEKHPGLLRAALLRYRGAIPLPGWPVLRDVLRLSSCTDLGARGIAPPCVAAGAW